jgi:hypothetical protein
MQKFNIITLLTLVFLIAIFSLSVDCKNNNFDMEPINVFQYIPTTTCINWHNFLTIQFLSLPVEHGNLVALALQ